MGTNEDRARSMIAANRYLTLAVCDEDGPWSCPINYVVGPDNLLYFYSARESRHSLAIAKNPLAAVSIFDASSSSAEVDGLQAEVLITIVNEEVALETIYEHYFKVNFDDDAERAWFYRPVTAFGTGGRWAFYKVAMQRAYVPDEDAMNRERLDARSEVDVAALVAPA